MGTFALGVGGAVLVWGLMSFKKSGEEYLLRHTRGYSVQELPGLSEAAVCLA